MNLMSKMISFGGSMVAVMLLIVGLAYYNMSQMSSGLTGISQLDLPLSGAMSTVTKGQLSQSAWLERALLAAELEATADLDRAAEAFTTEHEKIDRSLRDVQALVSSQRLSAVSRQYLSTLRADVDEVRRQYDNYYDTGSELFELLKAGEIIKADTTLKKLQGQSTTLRELPEPLAQRISDDAGVAAGELVDASQGALVSMSIIGLLAIAAALGLSFYITRTVLNQLGADPAELEKVAEHLAEGQLAIESSGDATGVAASIAATVARLQDVIRGIKAGAEEVGMASEQVGQGNTNLSQRTQEQASSLEEVAASMEEMTSTVNQNAENASQANALAIDASKQAEDGGQIAHQAVSAMNEINDASKRISEIITVIDDISFQINLLALNAAVEAARAGDQGRGFAVVAGEVRNLAGRSATAAKEIKELIQDSVNKVESGTRLVDETGQRLTEIVDSIRKVSDNVAEIAAASSEQSDGIAQVNRAILQMDDMTQQNASLVEQAAAASETVDAQARELRELVSFFKLGDERITDRMVREPVPTHSFERLFEPSAVPMNLAQTRKPASVREAVTSDDEWEQF